MRPALINTSALLIAVSAVFGVLPVFQDAALYSRLAVFVVLCVVLVMIHFKQINRMVLGKAWMLNNGLILSLLGVSIIPTFFLEGDMNAGYERLSIVCITLVFYLISASIEQNQRIKWIGRIGFFSLSLFCIWGGVDFLSALNESGITHQATYQIKASTGHRNLLAQLYWLLIPMSFLMVEKERKWKIPVLVVSLIAALLSIMMLSRGGWLVAFTSLCILVWYLIKSRKVLTKAVLTLGAVSTFTLVLYFLFVSDGLVTIQHHFETVTDITQGTTRDRILLIQRSFLLFWESPLFGIGAGNWPIEVMRFDQSGMLTSDGSIMYQRPHNDYVWLLSEYGLVTAGLWALLHILNCVVAFRNVIKFNRLTDYCLGSFWVVVILTSFTNFPLERPLFMMIIGLMAAFNFNRLHRLKSSSWKVLVVFLLALIPIVLSSRVIVAQYAMNKALSAAQIEQLDQYEKWLHQAKSFGLNRDSHNSSIEWHFGNLALMRGDNKEALAYFSEAIAQNPHHPYALNSMGVLLAQTLEGSGAELYFKAAIDHAPTFPDAWLNLALLQYGQDRNEEAIRSYLSANPVNNNSLYQPLGTRIAIDALNQLALKYPERKLYKTLEAMRNTPDWAFATIHHAALNGFTFEKQALIDAIYYMLAQCDSPSECEESRLIKQKYLPNQDLKIKE